MTLVASWFRSHAGAILATALTVSNSGLLSEKASVLLMAIVKLVSG